MDGAVPRVMVEVVEGPHGGGEEEFVAGEEKGRGQDLSILQSISRM